jgi:hypothetical protein
MKLRRFLPLFAGSALLSLPLSAQIFVGSDNFDDNTLTLDSLTGEQAGVWSYQSNSTGGSWVETGGRMEFRNPNVPSGSALRGFLAWVDTPESVSPVGGAGLSNGTPYNSAWTAQVSATNLLTGMAAGFALTGLEAYTRSSTGFNTYYGIYLQTGAGVTNLQLEWGYHDGSAWIRSAPTRTTIADTEDVLLRMTFDPSTKGLAFNYSFNSGTSFTAGATFDLDGTHAGLVAPYQDGIALQLVTANSAATGLAIGAGQMSFDNFSVTAIPEPSTYAALAGLGALGLALWRRQRRA